MGLEIYSDEHIEMYGDEVEEILLLIMGNDRGALVTDLSTVSDFFPFQRDSPDLKYLECIEKLHQFVGAELLPGSRFIWKYASLLREKRNASK